MRDDHGLVVPRQAVLVALTLIDCQCIGRRDRTLRGADGVQCHGSSFIVALPSEIPSFYHVNQ